MDWEQTYKPERKANIEDIVAIIHDSVTMEDALSVYSPSTPRRGHRCPCPIHNGKDFNMSYTDRGYKCFVCNASGDVISFVKEVCELSTRLDAIQRICHDFHLGVDFHTEITPQVSSKVNRLRAEAEAKRKAREEWEKKYHETYDAWIELDKIVMSIKPDTEANMAKLYKAKQMRDWAGHRLDMLLANEPR